MSSSQHFFKKVYALVCQIPEGRVCTYGLIAKGIGSEGAARMVGWALNAAHLEADIPAHRVVNRGGLLSGKHHFPGENLMQQLLENEGVEIRENKIVHLEKHLWIPPVFIEPK